MKKAWAWIRHVYDNVWSEIPWVRSAGLVGALASTLAVLNAQLPEAVALDLGERETGRLVLIGCIVVYFLLAAVYSGDRLRFEKKLRSLEQSFRYDKRGTLFNGSEPNIAFRIITFLRILDGVASKVGASELRPILEDAGRNASGDFANQFGSIYDNNIAPQPGKQRWDKLTLQGKVFEWTEYDSATGWGVLTSKIRDERIAVTVNHLNGLFQGEGGSQFAHFLAGYCETVLATIVAQHQKGRYSDYDGADFAKVDLAAENTVILHYVLK